MTWKEARREMMFAKRNVLKGSYIDQAYDKAIEALSQLERRKGEWINAYPSKEPNPMFMYGICSVCGYKQAISDKLNFCPDCGADMRGENDETD